MAQTVRLHRRSDDNLDTEHYMDRARQLRSMELRTMASGGRRALQRFLSVGQRLLRRQRGRDLHETA